jgi:O-succinylbenzoic acid--CoA ligase
LKGISVLNVVTDTEARLRRLGVLPGMRVAFHVPNSAALVVAVVACWRMGAVVVPLSLRYTKTQVADAIEGMAADVLVTEDMLKKLCPYEGDVFESVCLTDLDLDLSQDATIVLTSGSTGPPKGVLHTLMHHVASAKASNEVLPFVKGDVWLVSLPMNHVGGLALIMRALLHGGGLLFAGKDWPAMLVQKTVTHLSVVPTQLASLLAWPDTATALPQLKGVLVGGAPCPESLVHQAQALGVSVHITYGASEAASQITTTRQETVGCGRALSHAEVRIAQDGEILVRSKSLCKGYVTEGRVVALPGDQGWFHTGDLGSLDAQGHLFVLGRKDTQFISGGENIRPEEIEQVLLQVPEIEQCVVVPVRDATFGQRPVVFVAYSGGTSSCTEAVNKVLCCLEKFKHPDYIFDWPLEFAGSMKPDRPSLERLAESLMPHS